MRAKIRGRGRPPVDSEEVRARLPRDLLDAMDKVTADSERFGDETITRPELIRIVMREWLKENGYL